MKYHHRPIRVAHVTLGLNMGGQEKLLVEFARHADRGRFELHFIVLGQRGKLAQAIEQCGWGVRVLEIPEGVQPGLVFRLLKLFRDGGFDVVHTHDDKPVIYAAPAARLARVPVVVHTHHHGWIPQISKRQAMLVGLASRFVDRFVCVSKDSQTYVTAAGVPRAKTMVVHNGIDLTRFGYSGPNPTGPALTIARLTPAKGIDVLLRATAKVLQSTPDFRLEIAGAGESAQELRKQARELELTNAVRFLGEVDDVPALLATARMFVLSSFSEGISLTLLEAMARGLPIVATRVGGVPELVVEGETGTMVPAHDVHALAAGMGAMWANAERGRALGDAGRRRVEQYFDVHRMIARYEDLYAEPLANRVGQAAGLPADFGRPAACPT